MKYKDPITGELKEIYTTPGGDTLPIGAIVEIEDTAEIPYGYTQVGNLSEISFGVLPNNTSKIVATTIPSTATIKKFFAKAENSSKSILAIPHFSTSGNHIQIGIYPVSGFYNIEIKTVSDMTTYAGTVTIEWV